MSWFKHPEKHTAFPTLKHVRGRRDECSLLAVCTAQALDYWDESDRFTQEQGIGFGECCKKQFRMVEVSAFIEKLWGPYPLWLNYSRPRVDDLKVWETTLDLKGVGILTTNNPITKYRHAVAYQDGWIYDGNYPEPTRYPLWSLRIDQNCVIDGMQRKAKK